MKKANVCKVIIVVCLFLHAFFLTACVPLEDPVVSSLGEYENRAVFTHGEFQDYTDYAKYYYTAAKLAENIYFQSVLETDLPSINTYLDDFEGWLEVIQSSEPTDEIVTNYDFERAIMDTEDYFYLDSEEHSWSDGHTSLVKYDLYFFDSQTQVLYYFHNNI